jgi:hypothetical protein
MKLSLLVLTAGKQEGKVLEIKLPQFLVGRDPQCHLRPASPLISKRHCALIQRDGKVFIRDFGSTNGTFVNEEPVEGERELHHDDQLKIGPVAFGVRIEEGAAPTRTPVPATKATGKTPAPANKAAPSVSTPTPAPTSKSASAGAEDDIAAMLLSLDDGESPSAGSVPEGSTVYDLPVPPPGAAPPGAAPPGEAKPGQPQPAKGATGDTRSAAARILEKMTKRPRA